ncbi:fluoride efflux transporter CrcB [Bacillus sp. JJ1532]|uniref:fluoride efflux transporter CrcB n=1 Tax=unclassified Bacillus (in: firmicutes) TaxID=185979 RepID=UPI002FFF7B6B
MTYVFIGIGGIVGSLLRFFLFTISVSLWGEGFPIGTLITNIIGALLLGLFTKKFSLSGRMNQQLKVAISTGAIGSFTTLSALSSDAVLLLTRGSYFFAFLYVFISLFGGLAAIYLGFKLVEQRDREEEK